MDSKGVKIDDSDWFQPELKKSGRGGRRPGAGRKKNPDSLVFKTVGLTPEQWEWLSLWLPTGSPSNQLRELLARSEKFWPLGPHAFGHKV